MKQSDRIWITWEKQRRSLELAKKLNCKLYVFEYEGLWRYPKCIYKTLKVMFTTDAKVVFVQNPSMVLAGLACFLKFILGKKVIVDRHTTFRLNKHKKWSFKICTFEILSFFTIRFADLTIVTNDFLAKLVVDKNGAPFVLPDKLPEIKKTKEVNLRKGFNIFMISSFGNDEPIKEVILAAKQIQLENFNLYISGNPKKLDQEIIKNAPENVIFTGFLSDEDFFNSICAANAVMALTTADCCMLCGCYEAVAAEKPLVTSNKKVLKDYFTGCVFVDNTKETIIEGLHEIYANYDKYISNIHNLKIEIDLDWEAKYIDLLNNVEKL